MSSAPKDSDSPMAGARTARLGLVWEAANALAAAQMPKQTANSIDYSSLIPLHNHRLVDPAIAPTSQPHRRTRSRLVATLCLVAVILIGGTSAIIDFRQFPLANIWRDYISPLTQLHQPTSTMGSQQAIPRLRVESSRGMSEEPVPLGLAIDGPAKGAVVIITGVLAEMEISTGNEVGAHRWELLPGDIPYAFVAPPKKFVGFVDLVAELRLADDEIVDRQPIYLEWGPASPPGFAENQYNREEPAEPNPRVASVADWEKTASISSSPSSAADRVEQQEVLALPSKPVPRDPDREKTPAIPSSTTPTPGPQELTASSNPLVASDPDIKKRAVVASSPSLAQNQVGREEAMVPLSFPRNAQKQVDRDQPVTESGLPAFAQRQLDTEEIAVLLKRGKDLIAHGDIAAARVTLKRAAEANDADAALALASTYDPFVLRELKVYGFPADPAKARAWYEKAKELGSAVAPRRLEMLAREAR